MKTKSSIKYLCISLTPLLFTSCPGPVPKPKPDDDKDKPTNESVVTSQTATTNVSFVKPAENILKDLGMENKAIPSDDRIVGLEKSLHSPLSLQLEAGKLAQNRHNSRQIDEIKRACRVKKPGSFLLVVKTEDTALLKSISLVFAKNPKIECVEAGTTTTVDQVDLILKLY